MSSLRCPFISSHFFGMKEAENLAFRDQELCVATHLFAEEINTESDLVGQNSTHDRQDAWQPMSERCEIKFRVM